MLGESIETSAGDPDEGRPGQAGGRDEPVHRRTRGRGGQSAPRRSSAQIPDMQAYILNTGSIGAHDGFPGEKVTIKVSTEIMKQIAKEGIEWEKDPDWGYETPKSVPGLDLAKYSPKTYYSPSDTGSSSTGSAWSGARGSRSSRGSTPRSRGRSKRRERERGGLRDGRRQRFQGGARGRRRRGLLDLLHRRHEGDPLLPRASTSTTSRTTRRSRRSATCCGRAGFPGAKSSRRRAARSAPSVPLPPR